MNAVPVSASGSKQKHSRRKNAPLARHGRRKKFPAGSNGEGVARKDGDRPRKGRLQPRAAGLQHDQTGNELREASEQQRRFQRAARELGFAKADEAVKSRLIQGLERAVEEALEVKKTIDRLKSQPYQKRLDGFLHRYGYESEPIGFRSWYPVRWYNKYTFNPNWLKDWFIGVDNWTGVSKQEEVPCAMPGGRRFLREKFNREDILERWIRRQKLTFLTLKDWYAFWKSTRCHSMDEKLELRGYRIATRPRLRVSDTENWGPYLEEAKVFVNGQQVEVNKESWEVLMKMNAMRKAIA